jgi:hypothetical protein
VGAKRNRNRILCVFCDTRGERAREDIVSQWIARELQPPDRSTVLVQTLKYMGSELLHRRTNRWGSFATYKAKHVCKTCNEGWMSRLDMSAKPRLLPLIRGEPATLDAAAQKTIEQWAVLKTFAFDDYYSPPYLIPASDFHAFYHDQLEPRARTVHIGAHDGPTAGVLMPSSHRYLEARDSSDVLLAKAVRVTVNLKHFVFQVHIYGDNGPSEFLGPSDDSYLIRLGEPDAAADIHWPPRQVMDMDALRKIM